MAWQTREPRAAVRSRVRVGWALRGLEAVDDAVSAGRISFEHARVVAGAAANPRVEREVGEVADQVVAWAAANPYPVWRGQVRELVELVDQDGGFDPDRDLARNRCSLTQLGADRLAVRAELVGEAALWSPSSSRPPRTVSSADAAAIITTPMTCRCRAVPRCWRWVWPS